MNRQSNCHAISAECSNAEYSFSQSGRHERMIGSLKGYFIRPLHRYCPFPHHQDFLPIFIKSWSRHHTSRIKSSKMDTATSQPVATTLMTLNPPSQKTEQKQDSKVWRLRGGGTFLRCCECLTYVSGRIRLYWPLEFCVYASSVRLANLKKCVAAEPIRTNVIRFLEMLI